MDTAGICQTDDDIESEGVQLALDKIAHADLVLYMLDASRPLESDDRRIEEELLGRDFIVVLNKCDLPQAISLHGTLLNHETVRISTLTGDGIDTLLLAINTRFLHGRAIDSREYMALSNVRHRDALEKCAATLHSFAADAAARLDPELLAVDLRDALKLLGEITGETTADDILDRIFKQFCIGK
jgi:tRNA modification GTPase